MAKLTEKEFTDLKSAAQRQAEIEQAIGKLESRKMQMLRDHAMISDTLNKLQQRLAKKYGKNGAVNMSTGEFTAGE